MWVVGGSDVFVYIWALLGWLEGLVNSMSGYT